MSVTLQKALRILRTQGVEALVKRGGNEIAGALSALITLRKQPQFDNPNDLLDFANDRFGGLIAPFQVRNEILPLLAVVRAQEPKTILEIGTANGGTLFLWTRTAAFDAHLISLDLPGGKFGDGYAVWRIPIYRSFAHNKQRIDLLRGNSHSTLTRSKIVKLLQGKQVDFLFVDAGHTYNDVRQDFEMYCNLVAPGGLIAFHDISEHPKASGCEVHRFWSEVKSQYESYEFIADRGQVWAGIGCIKWNPVNQITSTVSAQIVSA
jgi:predicted O-methyltransferase YrrM